MTNYLMLLISLTFCMGSFGNLISLDKSNKFVYTIKPVPNEKKLSVELVFQGGEDRLTEIEIPISWTGKPFEEIVNLECYTNAQRYEIDTSSNSIIIPHEPYEEIKVKYDIMTFETVQDIHSVYFQDKDFFRFTGDLFIIPKADFCEKAIIILEWKDIPFNWSIANSFGVHELKQELTLPLLSLRLGLFIGGEISVIKNTDDENAPYIVMQNPQLFSTERLFPLLQTIIQKQRDFWNDHHFPHFLISVISSDAQQGIYAEAKLNAFIVFTPPPMEDKDWKLLTWVLTHEHFHTWNPFKMLPSLPDNFESLAWFTEGFTEYYTAVMCYRAQVLNFNECTKEINHLVYSYYTSPFRNITNECSQKERWHDTQIQLLAYQRGSLLALLWDSKIRQKTSGQYSLDDVMRDLIQKIQDTNLPISMPIIQEFVGKYLNNVEEAAQDIQEYIIEGKTIIPPNNIFIGPFDVRWFNDVGFDLCQAQGEGIIRGVIIDSHAYNAGLRNGQNFLRYNQGDDNVISVIVADDLIERKISYHLSSDQLIPQYVLRDS